LILAGGRFVGYNGKKNEVVYEMAVYGYIRVSSVDQNEDRHGYHIF
jgi:hypothetical protein